MKVYISGPIDTDTPGADRDERKARFNRCASYIKEHYPGWEPINPLEVGACIDIDAVKCELGIENINTHTWECWLRHDIIAMLACEAIVLLPGWKQSRGASFEGWIAQRLGFKAYFADEDGRVF